MFTGGEKETHPGERSRRGNQSAKGWGGDKQMGRRRTGEMVGKGRGLLRRGCQEVVQKVGLHLDSW